MSERFSELDDIFPTDWCFKMEWARRPAGWLQMACMAETDKMVFVVTSAWSEKLGHHWLHATSWGGQEPLNEKTWTPFAWRMAEGCKIAPPNP